jgi:hypothetical protein
VLPRVSKAMTRVERITMEPSGERDVASGTWNRVSRGSIDGAGGPDSNSRAYAFSLPLAA